MHKKLFIFIILFSLFAVKVFAADCQNNASFDELTQTCQCKPGYIMQSGNCITQNENCQNSFGKNSLYDAANNRCKCEYGYIAVQGQCVNANSYCQDTYGIHSLYNSSSKNCVCEKGYLLFDNSCVDGDKYCHSKTGEYSSYDILSKDCVCKDNYNLVNGQCVTVELQNVSPSVGKAGDIIKINGANFGSQDKNVIYVGSYLISAEDIISWSDKQIVFKVADYLKSGNVSLETSAKTFEGPYFEVREEEQKQAETKTETQTKTQEADSSKELTLNQNINITGASDAEVQNTASATKESITKEVTSAKTATSETQTGSGFLSFLGSLTAGFFSGIINLFSAIFG